MSTPASSVQLLPTPLNVQKPALDAEGPRRLKLGPVRVPGHKVHVQRRGSFGGDSFWSKAQRRLSGPSFRLGASVGREAQELELSGAAVPVTPVCSGSPAFWFSPGGPRRVARPCDPRSVAPPLLASPL